MDALSGQDTECILDAFGVEHTEWMHLVWNTLGGSTESITLRGETFPRLRRETCAPRGVCCRRGRQIYRYRKGGRERHIERERVSETE